MPRVVQILAAASAQDRPFADTVVLDRAARRVQHGTLRGQNGTAMELDLPAPVMLRMGDALELEDARLVEVVAAPEPLIEARMADFSALARLAWQLGDRHVPVQILANRIRLARDPAVERLLISLGARITAIEAPFDPEGGAYLAASHHHHEHHHHDHDCHHHDHADKSR